MLKIISFMGMPPDVRVQYTVREAQIPYGGTRRFAANECRSVQNKPKKDDEGNGGLRVGGRSSSFMDSIYRTGLFKSKSKKQPTVPLRLI